MTAGSIPVPTVVPLRVPGLGESKFNIDSNTRVELRSAISASENVSIYYTINGTRPDPFNKNNHLHRSTYLYTGPFTLPPGKVVLKAVACIPDGKESGVNTKTLHVTYVEPEVSSGPDNLEDNETSFRKTMSSMNFSKGISPEWTMSSAVVSQHKPKSPSAMYTKDASRRTFSPQRSAFAEKTDLSYEMNVNRVYPPNLSGDCPPRTTHTAMRVSRETDFLRCICCFARRPADPKAKFCNECGYPVSPLTDKQLPPPEPGQMGVCIKCQSTVPLNTDKCVVCEFDLKEQFQPQATLRTSEKTKCVECYALNPPSIQYCLKCEARLNPNDIVMVKNNVDKPPVNTSLLMGGDDDSMMTCSKCGRVNSCDARFCDWCGTKPKKPSCVSQCLKCTATNQPYAQFCSTCGSVLEAPDRRDARNSGTLISGLSIKDALKTMDSRAAATWLPMAPPTVTKKQSATVQTQTVGLFYPSTKTLEKYLAEDDSRRVFKEEKKIPLSGVSPGKGYWRQNVDFITNHLKAHSQNDSDFRKMIGEHKLGKLMSATIHEDGHEFSLVLNFPIRSNREHNGVDPFKGKNMSIHRNTVVGGYPIQQRGGAAAFSDEDGVESDTDPSDVDTAVSSMISHKDKDIIGNTKQKIKKPPKKKSSTKKESKKDKKENEHLNSVNRLLLAEVGEKGSGDAETVKQLLSEDGADVNCVNSNGESLLTVAVKNKRDQCISAIAEKGGVEVNKKSGLNGNTALHEAVLLGNSGKSTVDILLSMGANTNKKNDKGQTAYQLASEKGHESIITSLAVTMGQDMLDKIASSQSNNHLDYTNDMVY